jgi:hypothetical protein
MFRKMIEFRIDNKSFRKIAHFRDISARNIVCPHENHKNIK